MPPRPHETPYTATFQVPLKFNKLDLRDYLWHAYGVAIGPGVRSWTRGLPPRRGWHPQIKNIAVRGLVVPKPEKYMSVTLTRPFVWPEKPADLAPWDRALFGKVEAQQRAAFEVRRAHQRDGVLPLESREPASAARILLAQQARELLSGKRTWEAGKGVDPRWSSSAAEEEKAEARTGMGQTSGETPYEKSV